MEEDIIEIEEEGKIRHKKVFYDNIWFDSNLEVSVYKFLRKSGLKPAYNQKTFELFPGFKPTVIFYERCKDRKTHKNVFKPSMAKVQNIKYTPDFIFDYKGWHVIVEVKGHPNERYPMVRKMFRKLLETTAKPNFVFMQVKTVGDIKQGLNMLEPYGKTE